MHITHKHILIVHVFGKASGNSRLLAVQFWMSQKLFTKNEFFTVLEGRSTYSKSC